MNHLDEIHQLLDGELGDDHMAELLHRLSVDPEKRTMFRQQIVLQNALHHNESFDGLGVSDDWAVLEGIAAEVGLNQPAPVRRGLSNIAAIGVLLLGLLIGGGTGYFAGAMADGSPDTVRVVERVEVPVEVTRPAYDYNALIGSSYNLGADVLKPEPVADTRSQRSARHSSRKRPGFGTDVTGHKEAMDQMKNNNK
jgi:hypothetical protein